MNQLKVELDIISKKDTLEYEYTVYSNCAFIRLLVDGVHLITKIEDRKRLIVWDELKKTLLYSRNT